MINDLKTLSTEELRNLVRAANAEILNKERQSKEEWRAKLQKLIDECPFTIWFEDGYDDTQATEVVVTGGGDIYIR